MKKEMQFNKIKVIVCDTYEELSAEAAEIVAAEMKKVKKAMKLDYYEE